MDTYVKWWWSTHDDWHLVSIRMNRQEQWVEETWERMQEMSERPSSGTTATSSGRGTTAQAHAKSRPSSGTTATSSGTTAKAQATSGGKKHKKPKTEKKHKKNKNNNKSKKA